MHRLTLLLLWLACSGLTAHATHITVSGNVSGVWDVDTVLVAGEIRVPQNQTLTISPGVKVLFQTFCKLLIDTGATLSAIGTTQDSILFDAFYPSIGWDGLEFYSSSSSSRLEYCHITKAHAVGYEYPYRHGGGILCQNAFLAISHCLIDYCSSSNSPNLNSSMGGGIFFISSTLEISFSTLSFDSAKKGGAIAVQYSNANISNCLISENTAHSNISYYYAGGGGINIGSNSQAIITQNNISFNRADYGAGINSECYPVQVSNNNISFNIGTNTGGDGGGFQGSGVITNNKIIGNSAGSGGGINIDDGIIKGNYIADNTTTNGYGGGIACNGGNTTIVGNIICNNSAEGSGVGISTNCLTINNIVAGNIGNGFFSIDGGGISAWGGAEICNNYIISNSVQSFTGDGGGGIYLHDGDSLKCHNNVITGNTGFPRAGGILVWQTEANIFNNVITRNAASYYGSTSGGGIFFYQGSGTQVENDILSDDVPDELYLGSSLPIISYCNIQDTLWPGLGNISTYPAFVDTAHDDYRLLWGSPCIDSGHPDSLDPDGTRADMGAFYYDQHNPVRVLLTTYEIPYLIPDSGGTLEYALRLDTHLGTPQEVTFWCDVTLPDSSTFGPLLGPATATVFPGQMLSWQRFQGVPGSAPLGVHMYNAYAVVGDDTSKDSFLFGVMGFGSEPMDPWPNWGDPLGVPPSPQNSPAQPLQFALHGAYPNPFNPSTVLSFELRVPNLVSLKVYDTAGRLVSTLVNSTMSAGSHTATFYGSNLPSGVYIVRMAAGNFRAATKLVLVK